MAAETGHGEEGVWFAASSITPKGSTFYTRAKHGVTLGSSGAAPVLGEHWEDLVKVGKKLVVVGKQSPSRAWKIALGLVSSVNFGDPLPCLQGCYAQEGYEVC